EGGQGPPAVGPVVGSRGDREPEGRGDRVDAGGGGGQDQRQGDGVGRGQGTDVRSAHPTPWPARTRFVRGLVVGLRPVIANGVACEVGHGREGRGGRVGGHAQSSGTQAVSTTGTGVPRWTITDSARSRTPPSRTDSDSPAAAPARSAHPVRLARTSSSISTHPV